MPPRTTPPSPRLPLTHLAHAYGVGFFSCSRLRGRRRWVPLGSRLRLEDLLGDVEVGGYGLDVVELVEPLDQAQQAIRLAAADRDDRLRLHRDLGRARLDPG